MAPLKIPFDNTYARLPECFFVSRSPKKVKAPTLILFNNDLAEELGIDYSQSSDEALAAIFSGNDIIEGAEPLSQVYAGHQFGNFVPQLGDGRACLLGEVIDKNGIRRDIQLKGSGPTPFSRRGDGRAALGPVLREYLVSEAMHALHVPTTRSLAATLTGEPVIRETVLPGAILTRIGTSHMRVGTFQYFAAQYDHEGLKTLTDYAISRHYPECQTRDNPTLAFLLEVLKKQAALIARWMSYGFIHGVMNTDNMSIAGDTIDYGPCAFLDIYHPSQKFSAIDEMGRYAFGNQPPIGQWNLVKLAQSLLPLIDEDENRSIEKAQEVINHYPTLFKEHFTTLFAKKLGLNTPQEGDETLVEDFLDILQQEEADFTLSFRQLTNWLDGNQEKEASVLNLAKHQDWLSRWRQRLDKSPLSPKETMELILSVNPALIPRNHLVEQAISAAEDKQDFSPFYQLTDLLKNPFDAKHDDTSFSQPPKVTERVYQTFCGT